MCVEYRTKTKTKPTQLYNSFSSIVGQCRAVAFWERGQGKRGVEREHDLPLPILACFPLQTYTSGKMNSAPEKKKSLWYRQRSVKFCNRLSIPLPSAWQVHLDRIPSPYGTFPYLVMLMPTTGAIIALLLISWMNLIVCGVAVLPPVTLWVKDGAIDVWVWLLVILKGAVS